MALKCNVCNQVLKRGTAHDHDRDGRADPRRHNPHPPADGETPEGEPVIVPPSRSSRNLAGPPSSQRPGHGLPEYGGSPHAPSDRVEENTRDRRSRPEPEQRQSGPPSSERPGHGLPEYGGSPHAPSDRVETTRDRRSQSDDTDDTDDDLPSGPPSSQRPGHGLPEYGSEPDPEPTPKPRPKTKPAPEPDDPDPVPLSPPPPAGFDDYADPGEQQGADWQAWQPGAISPQAPMLDYEEYGDFGAPAPITPQAPMLDYEEYGPDTFDDTSKWWQTPDSGLWLPQSGQREREDYGGMFAKPEPIPEESAPWYSRGMTNVFDAPLPFAPIYSLRDMAESAGYTFSLPHEGVWWVADQFASEDPAADMGMFADVYGYGAPAAGAEELSAVERSYKWARESPVFKDIHLADFLDAMMMRKTETGTAVREALPGASIPLLSLVPGQDLALAYSDDKAITGADWIAAAELGLEFVPVGAAVKAPIRGARTVLPTRLGGGFSRVTSPATNVARLMAGKTDEAALEASIRLRNQIAEQGFGDVEVGGQVYRVHQTALDRALRDANPNATLSTTAAEDVAKFAEADVMPFKPQHANRPSEQFQFRTPGGSGVLHFAERTAYGNVGDAPGLVVYGDVLDDLAIPDSYKEPLGVKHYAGGRELELGVPTGGQVHGVRKVNAFVDHPADLYLDEALTAPSYSQRVRANVEGAVDVLRGRKGQVHGVKADADE